MTSYGVRFLRIPRRWRTASRKCVNRTPRLSPVREQAASRMRRRSMPWNGNIGLIRRSFAVVIHSVVQKSVCTIANSIGTTSGSPLQWTYRLCARHRGLGLDLQRRVVRGDPGGLCKTGCGTLFFRAERPFPRRRRSMRDDQAVGRTVLQIGN